MTFEWNIYIFTSWWTCKDICNNGKVGRLFLNFSCLSNVDWIFFARVGRNNENNITDKFDNQPLSKSQCLHCSFCPVEIVPFLALSTVVLDKILSNRH